MKILLFDVNGYVLGIRGIDLISAVLKKSGNDVKKVSLIRKEDYNYNDDELLPLKGMIEESNLVMISVYSNHVNRATQITKLIKKIDKSKIVIWGGPHCIAMPEMNLDIADIVCYSEGEQVVNEIIDSINKKKGLSKIGNIAYKEDGVIKKNKLISPVSDLDSIPLSDHDFKTHYILDTTLERTSDFDLQTFYRKINEEPMLAVLATRGCHFKCSYCNNSKQLDLFGNSYIRSRSVDNYFAEIKSLIKLYKVDRVGFADDDFLMRSAGELEEFIEKYNVEINLPFAIFMSPSSFSKEKMDILVKGKLVRVRLGVQSGSDRILKEIYNRHYPIKKTLEMLTEFKHYAENYDVKLNVNFIIDNPYEKQIDIYKTYKIMLSLPKYYKIKALNLSFFPGTPLYSRAIEDGTITPEHRSVFRSFNGDILFQKNFITYITKSYRYSNRNSFIKRSIYKMFVFVPFYYLGMFFLNPIIRYILNKKLKQGNAF